MFSGRQSVCFFNCQRKIPYMDAVYNHFHVCYVRLCGNKCDVQAAFLNYLDGFSVANTQYSNFTLSNVRVSLHTPSETAHTNAKQQLAAAAVDLVSPRGEKAYDERVLAWRLKRVEAYTHSRIQWALSNKNRQNSGGEANKDRDLEGDLDLQDSDSYRESMRKVSTLRTCTHVIAS